MWSLRNLLLIAIAAGALIIVGCAKDDEDNGTDQEALKQLMAEDQDIESVDAWSGDDNLGGGGGLDEEIDPVRWGRVGHRRLENVTVEFQGDTLATITRTISFNGELRIGSPVNDSTWHRYDKPMYNTIVRKAHAVRIARTPRPRQNWRITEVTPTVMTSAVPNPHTIEPARVEVYRNAGADWELVADITDPLNTYFARDTLPWVEAEQEVQVFVHANTTDPAVGVLHPHVYRHGRHPRLMLLDDGVYPDVAAGDGIYSGSYVTGVIRGVFVSGFDLLDWETLHDSEAPYDAGGWAVPYRVVVD